jgi:Leucine-rich repeat (LRR) protein
MKGIERIEDQAFFSGSTADLARAIVGGALDRCSSLTVEGKLTTVPPEIARMGHLRELILDTDTVQTIDPAIFVCTALVKLAVLSNQIKELPAGGWRRLAALEQLVLTKSRALRSLPDDLGDAARLVGEFDLTPLTKLHSLPPSFGRLARVAFLRLPPGVAAPDPIAGMAALRRLSVRGVDRLPADLGALLQLETVDASDCPLTTLPDSLGGAPALRSLTLARTQLRALPDSITRAPQLAELDLQQTPLESLPEATGALPLTRLRLQHTAITHLPASLAAPAASDLRVYLPRAQQAAIEASSADVLAALGPRVRFE